MIESTKGIVLKTIKYRDTSAIVDIFTRKLGLKTYLINGVYKAKPRVAPSLLQLGATLQLVVYNKSGRNMNRVKEIQADFYPSATVNDLKRTAIKLFMVELSRKTLRFEVPQSDLFDDFRQLIYQLEYNRKIGMNYHLFFLVRLLFYLGISPDLSRWPECQVLSIEEGTLIEGVPGKGHIIPKALMKIWVDLEHETVESLQEMQLYRQQRQDFIQHLLMYYSYHLDNFPQLHTHLIYKKLL